MNLTRLKRCLFLIVLCYSLVPSVHSQEDASPADPVEKKMGQMLKHDPSTQGQIRAFQTAEKDWQAAMDHLLGKLRKQLPADQRDLLEHSQHDWLAFRDSEEALRISFNAGRRGTMVGMLAVEARAIFIRDRVVTLRRYAEKSRRDS